MKTVTISHIRVCGANGASSSITAGIPSIPAILGLVKNLERHMEGLTFPETAIVLHSCTAEGRPLFYRGTRVMRPLVCRMPLLHDGSTRPLESSITTKLDVSLVLKVGGGDFGRKEAEASFLEKVRSLMMGFRFAGGTIVGIGGIWMSDERDRRLFRSLCPGYALVSRKEEFAELMKDGRDALELLVECCGAKKTEEGYSRVFPGWTVPISVGYMALSEPAEGVGKARGPWPVVFGEALVTLGECVFVTRISDYAKAFWRYSQDGGIYECVCGSSTKEK